MPDTTTTIIDTNSALYDSLSLELKAKVAEIIANEQTPQPSSGFSNDSLVMAVLFAGFIVFRWLWKNNHVTVETQVVNNTLVYDGKKLNLSNNEIVDILSKFFPYYKNLEPYLQQQFLKRLKAFMASKAFVIYAREGYKEMPVLLSAAAIQITFGLKKFLLPHYKYICIHPQEYFADNSFRVLAGHVKGNAITLAWNRFLNGFQYEHDGSNVGLHEMAHALYYQHIEVDLFKPQLFTSHFDNVMELGEDVYELKHQNTQLFTSYAFTNLQEFWAESVELFFEKPMELKKHYSNLFDTLCKLLNQNPANKAAPVELNK